MADSSFEAGPDREYFRLPIVWLLSVSAFILPLIMVPWLHDPYTLPKAVFVRAVVGSALLLWALRGAFERALPWAGHPIVFPTVGFMGAAVSAALFSTNRLLSFYGNYKRYEDVFTLVIYGLIVLIAVNNVRKANISPVLHAWLTAGALVSVYAVAQYFGYDLVTTAGKDGRAIATIGNAVFLGSWLVLTAPIVLNRLLEAWSQAGNAHGPRGRADVMRAAAYLVLAGGLTAAIAATSSRAAWLGLAVGILALFIFRRRAGRPSGSWPVVAVSVVVIFTVLNFVGPARTGTTLIKRAASSAQLDQGTVRTRLLLWRTSAALISSRPFFGYGPDALGAVYDLNLPAEFRKIEPTARIDKAHNDILNIGASLGLLGLAAYLAVLAVFFRTAWTGLGRSGATIADTPGLLAGIVGYLTASLFSFSQIEVSFFFWLALGLALVSLPQGAGKAGEGSALSAGPGRSAVRLAGAASVGLIWIAVLQFLAIKPVMADYHFGRGVRAESRHLNGPARSEFERATEISSARGIYYLGLARRLHLDVMARVEKEGIEEQTPALKDALNAYGAAEKLEPTNAGLYSSLGGLYTFLATYDVRYGDLAGVAYKRSLSLNPFLSQTYVNRGVLEARSGNLRAARTSFRRAIKLDPENTTARSNLGALDGR